jgi:colanic acid/amylovoran biosynthesis glycosyltransferase
VLLHAHFAVDAAYFCWLRDAVDVPLVVSCYGYDVSGFPHRFWGIGKAYLRRVFETADLFLAMSDDMKRDLLELGCPGDRILVHYHGIDLQRFRYVDRSSRDAGLVRILFVGSLTEKKGATDVLRAFARVMTGHRHVELRLVGDGPLRPQLLREAQALGCADRVTFAGFVEHAAVPEELAAADIFCLPSAVDRDGNKEGIPGTIVEAQSSGLPVVSTKHAGIPYVVLEGQTGFLVPERDIQGLAGKITMLLERPELRRSLGRAGSEHARGVADADIQARRLECIYSSVLQGRWGAEAVPDPC